QSSQANMPTLSTGKVLVSGANGFIAVWVVRTFLEEGYAVRGTVRSEDKGKHLIETFKSYGDKFEVVVVPDITADGAFDEAVKGVQAIAHTASPFHFQAEDPAVLIDPAVKGTVGMLKSVLKNGKDVKRIVVTSSAAAIVSVYPEPTHFSEENWNDQSVEEVEKLGRKASVISKYRASKTLAERGAWNFVKEHASEIGWDLTVLNPPLVLGPEIHAVSTPAELNTSSRMMYQGLTQAGATVGGGSWVDVRDLALAHVRAIQKEEAGGERIIVCEGTYTWQDMIDALPPAAVASGKYQKGTPGSGKDFKQMTTYDNSKGLRILGIKYRTVKDVTADTVAQWEGRGW
ncbi:unnamed protein product, partial [Mycena citricolor]